MRVCYHYYLGTGISLAHVITLYTALSKSHNKHDCNKLFHTPCFLDLAKLKAWGWG